MGITISSPRHSFVQFNQTVDETCDKVSYSLPVIGENDWRFQVFATMGSTLEADAFMGLLDTDIQLLLVNGTENTSATVAANTLVNFTSAHARKFGKYRTSSTEVVLTWTQEMTNLLEETRCDQCFQLAIKIPDGEGGFYYHFSNVFIRKCDPCWTSIINYSCEENAMSFKYCDVGGFVNRARLHMYVTRPVFPTTKSVYPKSNGVHKILKAVIRKEYEGQTEHYPEQMHEKINIMLHHDQVEMVSDRYTGGLRISNEYEPEWDDEHPYAPGKFKANATPYDVRNDNCDNCQDICPQITALTKTVDFVGAGPDWECIITAVGWEFTPAWATTAKVYYKEGGTATAFTLAGTVTIGTGGVLTSPLTITPIAGAWKSIDIRIVSLCSGELTDFVNIEDPV